MSYHMDSVVLDSTLPVPPPPADARVVHSDGTETPVGLTYLGIRRDKFHIWRTHPGVVVAPENFLCDETPYCAEVYLGEGRSVIMIPEDQMPEEIATALAAAETEDRREYTPRPRPRRVEEG